MGGTKPNQTTNTLNMFPGSETAGAKIRSREGKSPRPSAKVPKIVLSGKGCGVTQTARMLA